MNGRFESVQKCSPECNWMLVYAEVPSSCVSFSCSKTLYIYSQLMRPVYRLLLACFYIRLMVSEENLRKRVNFQSRGESSEKESLKSVAYRRPCLVSRFEDAPSRETSPVAGDALRAFRRQRTDRRPAAFRSGPNWIIASTHTIMQIVRSAMFFVLR